MSFFKWLRKSNERLGAHSDPRRTRSFKPCVETLERRLTPAPALLTSFEGVNIDDSCPPGLVCFPPDAHGAVGPNHVVNVVNSSIQWHTKPGGAPPNTQLLNDFFFPNSPDTLLFDPKVIYDQYNDRFVVVALEVDGLGDSEPSNDVSRIHVGVSATDNPAGTWYHEVINSNVNIGGNNTLADYPGLAVSSEALYVTANQFLFTNVPEPFVDSRLFIINKTPLYSGGAISSTVHDVDSTQNIFTLQPAHMFGTAPTNVGTFLVSWVGAVGDDQLRVTRVDNPLSNPSFTSQLISLGNIDEGPFQTPDAPQRPEGSIPIETNDKRMLSAVWRNNLLYATNTVTPPVGSGADAEQATAHWYKVNTTTLSALTLADQGNIGGEDLGPQTHTYYPAVAVDAGGNMAIGFSASSKTLYAGAYYTERLASASEPGTVEPSGLLAAGQDFYFRRSPNDPRNRWGDYSGIAVDPTTGDFWVYNQYALTQDTQGDPFLGRGRWGTRWGSFRPPRDLASQVAGDDQTFALDSRGHLWHYRVVGNSWQSSGRAGVQIAVVDTGDSSPSNDVVFLRDYNNRVWRWNQVSWAPTNLWLRSIVGGDSQIFGLANDGGVWRYQTSASFLGAYGAELAIGDVGDGIASNDDVFLRGFDSRIWAWLGGQTWDNSGGYLAPGKMRAGDNQLFGIGFDNKVWRFRVVDRWMDMGAIGKSISISNVGDSNADNDLIFLHAFDNTVWWRTQQAGWTNIGTFQSIVAGDNQVFAVDFTGKVWRYRVSGAGSGWINSQGPPGVNHISIDVGSDGDSDPFNDRVFVIDANGKLWVWTQTGGWIQAPP